MSFCSQGGPPSKEGSARGFASSGSLHPGEGLHPVGVCIQGAVGQTPPLSNTTGYGQCEVGRHPTGMHSCLEIVPVLCVSLVIKTIELTMGMDPSSALT